MIYSQILYVDLKLPFNGEAENLGKPLGPLLKHNKMSSNKENLAKLTKYHKLPSVIMEWRRINNAVTKVICKMAAIQTPHPGLEMSRIYPVALTLSSNGRVHLEDPSIQMVPNDFEVEASKEFICKALGEDDEWFNQSSMLTPYSSLLVDETAPEDEKYSVSLRRAFVASRGCLIVAADYSQLELRILAHLSEDVALTNLLGAKNNADVFKAVASTWKKKPVEAVTTSERKCTKQIVYGIVYGMGVKKLSDDLGVGEYEAKAFMASFNNAFPGVREFVDKTLESTRKSGYILTLGGRRRYFPHINEPEGSARRSASERGAVNARVQGSGVDMVKKAMIDIDRRLAKKYPTSSIPLRFKKTKDQPRRDYLREGAHFILQLHDELIYEVCSEDLIDVVQIIRTSMEFAVPLNVPTPVSVKIGPSWGELQEIK